MNLGNNYTLEKKCNILQYLIGVWHANSESARVSLTLFVLIIIRSISSPCMQSNACYTGRNEARLGRPHP